MTACQDCPVGLLPASIGYVHSDTHNTHGADGHVARPVAVEHLAEVIYIDGWTPVPLPVEDDAERGVENQPYPRVSAVDVAADRDGLAPHLVLLDPWLLMSPAERDAHRDACPEPGCETCDGHRAWATCPGCGQYVELTDAGTCDYDGTNVPLTRDPSDVKVAER